MRFEYVPDRERRRKLLRVCGSWSLSRPNRSSQRWSIGENTRPRRHIRQTNTCNMNKRKLHLEVQGWAIFFFFLCFILNKRICRLWIDIAQEESKEDFILTTETDKPFNREGEMPHLNHEWGITIDDLDPVQVPTLKGSSENQRITYNADRGGSGIKRLTWTQTRSWTWWS